MKDPQQTASFVKTTPGITRLLFKPALLTTGLLISQLAMADPFADGDLTIGHEFHEDLCVACHAQRFDGEKGSTVYTRDERRVRSSGALTQQLTACTTMLNLDLFPEDEHHIAAYLNKHFYKFD